MSCNIFLAITIFLIEKIFEDYKIKRMVESEVILLLVLLIKMTIWVKQKHS